MDLAIVIPAFKTKFLKCTLESIVSQSNKNFHVYIGDDASPEDVYSIVKDFEERINITYNRFSNNLGSTSLVQHWHRCIDMIRDERWLWIFGDDDLMDSCCVQKFYDKLFEENCYYDVYRFGVQMIDALGQEIRIQKAEGIVNVYSFFYNRLTSKTDSFIVEYIFSKKKYDSLGGIPDFPLAWASDDAFWIMMGKEKGICSIDDAIVKWRYSGFNISSASDNWELKIKAGVMFLKTVNTELAGSERFAKHQTKWLWKQYTFHSKQKSFGTFYSFFRILNFAQRISLIRMYIKDVLLK